MARTSASPTPAAVPPAEEDGTATGAWWPGVDDEGDDEPVGDLVEVGDLFRPLADGDLTHPAAAASVFPFGTRLPFEPDPEAAAFLNAPRRPLTFYVAPFGTPPFGSPPPDLRRPDDVAPSWSGLAAVSAGADGAPPRGRPDWGPAYSAGA